MMKAKEVKQKLDDAGIKSPVEGAYIFQTQPITMRRWVDKGTSGCNAILLRLLASGKITIKDVEQAHD